MTKPIVAFDSTQATTFATATLNTLLDALDILENEGQRTKTERRRAELSAAGLRKFIHAALAKRDHDRELYSLAAERRSKTWASKLRVTLNDVLQGASSYADAAKYAGLKPSTLSCYLSNAKTHRFSKQTKLGVLVIERLPRETKTK